MILKQIKIKPSTEPEVYETESYDGLKWAVMFDEKHVIALFDSRFWAEHFIENSLMDHKFCIREVSED